MHLAYLVFAMALPGEPASLSAGEDAAAAATVTFEEGPFASWDFPEVFTPQDGFPGYFFLRDGERSLVLMIERGPANALAFKGIPYQFPDAQPSDPIEATLSWQLLRNADPPLFASLARPGEWSVLLVGHGRFEGDEIVQMLRGAQVREGQPLDTAGPSLDQLSWTEVFRKQTRGIESIKVFEVDMYFDEEEPAEPAPVLAIDDASDIATFVDLISIDEEDSGFAGACLGDWEIRLFRDDEHVTTLSWHHGFSLRWKHGDWPGDGSLTPDSRAAILDWFSGHGFAAPEQQWEQHLAQQRWREQEIESFVRHFPDEARDLLADDGTLMASPDGDSWEKEEMAAGQRLAEVVGDPVQLLVAVSRALAEADDDWSITMRKERVALASASTIDAESLRRGLRELSDEPQSLLGAARLFFHERLERLLPDEERDRWSVILAEAVLKGSNNDNKALVLRRLWQVETEAAVDLLKRVMRGHIGAGQDEDPFAEEPGLRPAAAVALGMHDRRELRSEIADLRKELAELFDVAAVDVALALLGDESRLREEYIRMDSHAIGYGLIAAIERFEGREGMDVLVALVRDHSWGAVNEEAFLAFERITGQSWSARKPRNMRVTRYTDELVDWWSRNGSAFIAERRAIESPNGH